MSMVEMDADMHAVGRALPTQNSDHDCSENQASDPENVCKQIIADSNFIRCQNGEEESDKEQHLDSNPRKKKHRRGKRHHRKWKPYNKLSWSERQAADERESRRATRKREEAFASGHPRAPFNTTQFLIEDHSTYVPIPSPLTTPHQDLARHHSKDRDPLTSCDSSEDYESTDEEKNFIAREFSETYDNIHAERLQSMSKESLIKEFTELESKLEQIQNQLKDTQTENNVTTDKSPTKKNPDGLCHHYLTNNEEFMDCEKRILRDEIQKLLAENERLKTEVENLKK